MKKINLILLAIVSLILLVSITSAQVSHPASEITAGTFGAGDFIINNDNEVFLSISNTEAGGHDYRLVSAGSVGRIGLGGFSIYDSTAGQSRLTIDANGVASFGNNRVTNVADPIVSSDVATKNYVDARVVSVLGGDGDSDGVPGLLDCNDADINVWQNKLGYPDNDGDGHYAPISPEDVCSGGELPSGYINYPGDDCDDDPLACGANCFPGSTTYTTSPDGYDQDCDGTVDEAVDKPTRTCTPPEYLDCYNHGADCNDYCGDVGLTGTISCPPFVPNRNYHWSVPCSINFETCGMTMGCDGWNHYTYNQITCDCDAKYY
jgi:hypothetical protein